MFWKRRAAFEQADVDPRLLDEEKTMQTISEQAEFGAFWGNGGHRSCLERHAETDGHRSLDPGVWAWPMLAQ